jgi:hypothetical protein
MQQSNAADDVDPGKREPRLPPDYFKAFIVCAFLLAFVLFMLYGLGYFVVVPVVKVAAKGVGAAAKRVNAVRGSKQPSFGVYS